MARAVRAQNIMHLRTVSLGHYRGSVRLVLAKQVGQQTSLLLSSAHGSSESSAASPKCGGHGRACARQR